MTLKPNVLWSMALISAWLFDFLFWGKIPGISFAIYVGLLAGAGWLLLRLTGQKLHPRSVLLLIAVFSLAIFSFIRLEPLSRFLAFALSLSLLALTAVSATGGGWPFFRAIDYLIKPLELAGSILTLAVGRQIQDRHERQPHIDVAGDETTEQNRRRTKAKAAAVLRGAILALPVLAVFIALLASADMIFAQRFREVIELFRLEKLPEYLLRGLIILALAFALAGTFLHLLFRSAEKLSKEPELDLGAPAASSLAGILGFTEAMVVLGSTIALFTSFVVIQFQYFFSGQANITLDGFSYSEYARRGFGELVIVAVFSLLLFLGLSAFTRRETRLKQRSFSGLGITLFALVAAILASAFQRLLLYEAAYGFSRLRTYPHIFMIWLGVLLAAVVLLEIVNGSRYFPAAVLLAAVGFAVTLNTINVDGLIARQNVLRAAAGAPLDIPYLVGLSDDAVPDLVSLYLFPGISDKTRDQTGAVLACMMKLKIAAVNQAEEDPNYRSEDGLEDSAADNQPDPIPWQSFHYSRWLAERRLAAVANRIDAYQIDYFDESAFPRQVTSPAGAQYPCYETRTSTDL